jgi:purine-nucleoside phosphorylase
VSPETLAAGRPHGERIAGAGHAHRADAVRAAADAVRERVGQGAVAHTAIILGTGLGALGRAIATEHTIDYADIPGFPLSTVESHAGRLLVGTLGGHRVMAMQGRFHKYEGYSLQQVTFPVRVLQALGAQVLIASNACGGMRPDWAAGDLMLIADHINLLGDNPLVGPNDPALGPRFPDLSEAYDPELRALAREVAARAGITLREGVYVAVAGPNLETRAEYRMLRSLGADVVGMSTVPEVIVARHGGMRALGVSIITDMCVPETLEPASLERILQVAAAAEPHLTTLVTGLVTSIGNGEMHEGAGKRGAH